MIGAAPRSVAMGEAFVGLADDVNAIAYNPAGLAFLERQEASLVHNVYIEGVQQDYLAYVYPTTRYGSLALGGNQVRVAPFSSYDVNDQPTGSVSAQDQAFTGAYAQNWGNLALGGAFKHINSRLASFSASGHAYDFGALWRLQRGLGLGVAIQNIGSGLTYERESAPLPRTIRLGGSWRGAFLWPGSTCGLTLDGVFARDRGGYVGAGAEVWAFPYAAVRVGYLGSQDSDIGFSWGVGFRIPLRRAPSEMPTWKARPREDVGPPPELQIDYAFARMGDMGITHRMSLSLRFGRTKQERTYAPDWKETKAAPKKAAAPLPAAPVKEEHINEGDMSPSWR